MISTTPNRPDSVENNEKLSRTEKDFKTVYKKIKRNKKYFISIKDIVVLESLVADGVILMGNIIRQGDLLRSLQVVKMRGAKHSRARHLIELTPVGLAVVPLLKWGQDGGQAFT